MKKITQILHGGDYNPEQWPCEEWEEDLSLLKKAHINTVTLNVFSWARLQPSDEVYDFALLDRMIQLYSQEGMNIILATGTAALPAWMVRKYPEVARTDFYGMHHKFGKRHNACPSSPVYRKYSAALAGKLAERYAGDPAIKMWHINNEYGGACFCENCERKFRLWLKEKYQTLDRLNEAWNTEFWSHTIHDWEEIVAPNRLGDGADYDTSAHEGISVDYRRFNSDNILENFCAEKAAIRQYDQDTPVTTNMMYLFKTLDYFAWAKEMDVASWDNYPTDESMPWEVAFWHDLMRGLKEGQPFWVMEQNPMQQTYNAVDRKIPGKMRARAYQAVAHGADALLYFQLKRSQGSCEKYCGAVIDHVGHGDTRIFREVTELGKELELLGDQLLDGRTESKVAVLYDWDSYWTVDYDRWRGLNKDWNYPETVMYYYRYFYDKHISVDIISRDMDFSKYQIVAAPMLYCIGEDTENKIKSYITNGGIFVSTYGSGLIRPDTRVILGGYPGALREAAGIWIEEMDYLPKGERSEIYMGKDGSMYETYCEQHCDVIHLEGACAEAVYGQKDLFYYGMPAVTCNDYGEGQMWYIGTRLLKQGLYTLFDRICEQRKIQPVVNGGKGLEITRRSRGGKNYYFIINYDKRPHKLPGRLTGYRDLLTGERLDKDKKLEWYDVVICTKD